MERKSEDVDIQSGQVVNSAGVGNGVFERA